MSFSRDDSSLCWDGDRSKEGGKATSHPLFLSRNDDGYDVRAGNMFSTVWVARMVMEKERPEDVAAAVSVGRQS